MDALFDRSVLPTAPRAATATRSKADTNRFRSTERQAGRRPVTVTLSVAHIALLDSLVSEERIRTGGGQGLRRDVITRLIVEEATRQGFVPAPTKGRGAE